MAGSHPGWRRAGRLHVSQGFVDFEDYCLIFSDYEGQLLTPPRFRSGAVLHRGMLTRGCDAEGNISRGEVVRNIAPVELITAPPLGRRTLRT